MFPKQMFLLRWNPSLMSALTSNISYKKGPRNTTCNAHLGNFHLLNCTAIISEFVRPCVREVQKKFSIELWNIWCACQVQKDATRKPLLSWPPNSSQTCRFVPDWNTYILQECRTHQMLLPWNSWTVHENFSSCRQLKLVDYIPVLLPNHRQLNLILVKILCSLPTDRGGASVHHGFERCEQVRAQLCWQTSLGQKFRTLDPLSENSRCLSGTGALFAERSQAFSVPCEEHKYYASKYISNWQQYSGGWVSVASIGSLRFIHDSATLITPDHRDIILSRRAERQKNGRGSRKNLSLQPRDRYKAVFYGCALSLCVRAVGSGTGRGLLPGRRTQPGPRPTADSRASAATEHRSFPVD